MSAVEEYLATLDEPARSALAHVVQTAHGIAPAAVEGRSYGVAALLVDGRPLLGVKATAKFLALYPFSPAAVDAVAGDVEARMLSKGTVRFIADRPLPDDVIERLVRARLAELAG